MAVWDVFDPGSGYDPTEGTAKAQFKPEQKEGLSQAKALQLGSRGKEAELGEWFRKGMLGQGPSVAEEQLQQGVAAAGRQARATAASARGANVALAGRAATQAATQASMAAGSQAAQLRAQEQQAYAQQYAGLVQAQRQQDLMAQGYSLEEAKAILDAETRKIEAQSTAKSQEAGRRYGLLSGILSDESAKTGVVQYGSDEDMKSGVFQVGSGMGLKTGIAPAPVGTIGFTAGAPATPTGAPAVTTGGAMTVPSVAAPAATGFTPEGPDNAKKLDTLASIASMFSSDKGEKGKDAGKSPSSMENAMSRLGVIGAVVGAMAAASDESLKSGIGPYGSGTDLKEERRGLMPGYGRQAGLLGMTPQGYTEDGVPSVVEPSVKRVYLSDETAKAGIGPYGSGMGFKTDVSPAATARFPDVGVPPPVPAGYPALGPRPGVARLPDVAQGPYAYGAPAPEPVITSAVRPRAARTPALESGSATRYALRDEAAAKKAEERPNDLLSFLREKESTRQKERKEETAKEEKASKKRETSETIGTIANILGKAGVLLAMSDETAKTGVQPFGSGMGFKTDAMPGIGSVQSSFGADLDPLQGMPGMGAVQWMGGGGGRGSEGMGGGGGLGGILGGGGGGGGGVPGLDVLSDRDAKDDARLAGQLEGLYAAAAMPDVPGRAEYPRLVQPGSVGRLPDVSAAVPGAPPGPPALDPNRAMSASLAGVADLNRRLDELERRKMSEVSGARSRARRY